MVMFRRKPVPAESVDAEAHRLALIENMTFEVVPLKSIGDAMDALPAGADVSVTCSPTKGIAETQRIAEELLARGFAAIPHVSARLVQDRAQVYDLAAWFRAVGLTRIFVVGGDAPESGAYPDAYHFMLDLFETDHGLETVGVTGYPDGHAFVSADRMQQALLDKQELLASAGVDGYVSTQMCFDPITIGKWMRCQRERGITLPIHLGLAGVVDKKRLMTMGVRLGIGQSLSYLRKNRTAVAKLMTSTHYDPNDLLIPLSADNLDLGVEALHVFTFNQVAATDEWRLSNL